MMLRSKKSFISLENRGIVKAAIVPFQAMMVFLSMPQWIIIGSMGFLITDLLYRWLEFKSITAHGPENELRRKLQLGILFASFVFAGSAMLAATMILPMSLTLLLQLSFVSFLIRNSLIILDNFLKMGIDSSIEDDIFKACYNIGFASFGIASSIFLFFEISLVAPFLLSSLGVFGSIMVFAVMVSCDIYMTAKTINSKLGGDALQSDQVPSVNGSDYKALRSRLLKQEEEGAYKEGRNGINGITLLRRVGFLCAKGAHVDSFQPHCNMMSHSRNNTVTFG